MAEYVDLSNLSIEFIEKLQQCPKLQTVILRGNLIQIVTNVENCHQLWRLDLGNNKISNLDGLSKFVALGELNLSNNDLTWTELMKIRNMHVLSLSLHGNKKMEKDPYYRIHVIDCLPNVWSLDGRIVTSAERVQVMQFFQDSALTDRPVRHRLTREQFVPTSMKKINVDGVYGEKTTHFMMRFPTTGGSLNSDTDHRRVRYLAFNLQRELQLEAQHRKIDSRIQYSDSFIESLLAARKEDRDRCNVLLILLVASLEFTLPTFLVQETLGAATISGMGGCNTIELFLMPRDHRCQLASLLLSAVKVDRDNKEDGGLYDKLYLCLYYTISELFKTWHRENPGPTTAKTKRANVIYREYISLLASEVVQLFCIVPVFFDCITKDSGIMRLVSVATSDQEISDKVAALVERIRMQGGTPHRTIEEVAELLISAIQRNTKLVLKTKLPMTLSSTYILSTPKALPRRPMSSPVHASFFLTAGKHSPERAASALPATPHSPRRHVVAPDIKMPTLGDKVLLGPQNMSFIIALPEPDIGLVQMESIPDLSKYYKVPNGSVVSFTKNTEQHFAYVDLTLVVWDRQYGYWKPQGTIGDRITIQKRNQYLPSNPPSSPTISRNDSPRVDSDNAAEDDNHKSTDKIGPDVPHSVSALLRERLKINPSIAAERVTTPSAKTSPRSSVAPIDSPDGSIGEADVETAENPDRSTDDAGEGLYDCLKCAVDVVQQATGVSPRNEKEIEEEKRDEDQEENVPDAWDVASQRTFSSRPMSGMTERAADYFLVDEFADANTSQENVRNRPLSSRHSRPLSSRQCNRPSTARGSPSRINSAKSTTSWRSLPVASSRVIEVDLRPDNVTNYQAERLEEWQHHAVVMKQPRSRQGSAYSRSSTRSRPMEPVGDPVFIRYANDWLAGGHDVHHRTQIMNRQKMQYSPGWMDGISQRPKSSSGFRAKPRQKDRRTVKSAGTSRDRVFNITRPASQPPPSPASSDHAFYQATDSSSNMSYVHQAKQHNHTVVPCGL